MAQLYWYCAFCHTGNHPAAVFCGSCGHPRPKPSFISKVTPGLLIVGGVLFAAGMAFAGLLAVIARAPQSEPRALRAAPSSTPISVTSSSPLPTSTSTPLAKKRTPTPTPTPADEEAVEAEVEVPSTAPTQPRSSGTREYILGPRGGCYYINGNGNKTYVDHSFCGTAPSRPATLTAPSRRSSSSIYIRGPRGGCYYINSHGNKTYVDRSLCN
jgi:hypothetical protein